MIRPHLLFFPPCSLCSNHTNLLVAQQTRQAPSCLRVFAWVVSSARMVLSTNIYVVPSLTSFRSLPKPFIKEVF